MTFNDKTFNVENALSAILNRSSKSIAITVNNFRAFYSNWMNISWFLEKKIDDALVYVQYP